MATFQQAMAELGHEAKTTFWSDNTYWDFIEKYLPNYHTREDVCLSNDINTLLAETGNASAECLLNVSQCVGDLYDYLLLCKRGIDLEMSLFKEAMLCFIEMFKEKAQNLNNSNWRDYTSELWDAANALKSIQQKAFDIECLEKDENRELHFARVEYNGRLDELLKDIL